MRSLAVCWKVHKRCLHFFSACSPFSTSENWQSVEIEEIDGSEVKKGKKVFFVEKAAWQCRTRVETQENNLWFANRVRPTLITLQTQCPLHYYRQPPPPPSQNWPLMMMMNHWQWIIALHSLLMMIGSRASYTARESSQKMMSSYFGWKLLCIIFWPLVEGIDWKSESPNEKLEFVCILCRKLSLKALLVFVLHKNKVEKCFKKCAANLQEYGLKCPMGGVAFTLHCWHISINLRLN